MEGGLGEVEGGLEEVEGGLEEAMRDPWEDLEPARTSPRPKRTVSDSVVEQVQEAPQEEYEIAGKEDMVKMKELGLPLGLRGGGGRRGGVDGREGEAGQGQEAGQEEEAAGGGGGGEGGV